MEFYGKIDEIRSKTWKDQYIIESSIFNLEGVSRISYKLHNFVYQENEENQEVTRSIGFVLIAERLSVELCTNEINGKQQPILFTFAQQNDSDTSFKGPLLTYLTLEPQDSNESWNRLSNFKIPGRIIVETYKKDRIDKIKNVYSVADLEVHLALQEAFPDEETFSSDVIFHGINSNPYLGKPY